MAELNLIENCPKVYWGEDCEVCPEYPCKYVLDVGEYGGIKS